MENEEMELISQTKLLGVIVNDSLTWEENTKYLVQRANSRLRLLHKLASFSVPKEDLVNIFSPGGACTAGGSRSGVGE